MGRLFACLLLACACARESVVTTPTARPLPTESDRRITALENERERWSRERRERQLDAVDPGELIEHARLVQQPLIDEGRYTTATLFLQGETVFERRFTPAEGLGIGADRPGLSRVQRAGAGPDAMSCVECHHRGGDDGAGELHHRAWLGGDGVHLRSAEPRIAPHLAGLGPVQLLAAQMSAQLAEVRTRLQQQPVIPTTPFPLEAEGVSFGTLALMADGGLDTSGVRGVDADLVIKPFGWKGAHATLRSFVRNALPQHMAMEPLPLPEQVDAGSFDEIERQPWLFDGDHDGVNGELTEGQLTSLAIYLALLDVPQVRPPQTPALREQWARGRAALDELGCTTCHRATLPLRSTEWVERAPGRDGGVSIDLVKDVQVPPALEQLDYGRTFELALFSDLKRHDLGAALATAPADGGVAPREFVTRPLWGIGTRGNAFLHDGRARTLDEAVFAHGGEAEPVTARYRAASPEVRASVNVFLLSLRRQPQVRLLP